jgi:hypothetical protein
MWMFLPAGEAKVHFDDAGERHERRPFRRIHEVIQRDRISRLLQALAGFDYFLVRFDVFENFDHRQVGWKKGNVVPEHEIAETVNEHAASRGNFFKADQKGGIQGRGRCQVKI